jgi:hypothetical protein
MYGLEVCWFVRDGRWSHSNGPGSLWKSDVVVVDMLGVEDQRDRRVEGGHINLGWQLCFKRYP